MVHRDAGGVSREVQSVGVRFLAGHRGSTCGAGRSDRRGAVRSAEGQNAVDGRRGRGVDRKSAWVYRRGKDGNREADRCGPRTFWAPVRIVRTAFSRRGVGLEFQQTAVPRDLPRILLLQMNLLPLERVRRPHLFPQAFLRPSEAVAAVRLHAAGGAWDEAASAFPSQELAGRSGAWERRRVPASHPEPAWREELHRLR